MSNLDQLLANRSQTSLRGVEGQKSGSIFYFTFTDTTSGRCQYTWQSPGNGIAVVEVWGASGSGGRQCCCSGHGIPGNPGAYSKKTVAVTSSSCICGFVGCAPEGNSLCYPGRSPCSVACFFNTSNNTTMNAQGGFGGYTNCTTITAHFCCLQAAGFCATLAENLLPVGAAFCGIVCNVGGPNGAVAAPASGGDINIPGGISCIRIWECCNFWPCMYQATLALSPGIYTSNCSPCVQFNFNQTPTRNGAVTATGRQEANMAVSSLSGVLPQSYQCWTGNMECGCYEFTGCYYGGVGIPGTTGMPCAAVRTAGMRGGHGAVKITFY
jgi:hypothetical protein